MSKILSRFEKLLHSYFADGRQLSAGMPTVQYCAERLAMSASYLSDVVRRTSGETASRFIKLHIVQLAKNRLASGMSVSETAYSLGFDYPQHFSRTFKKISGETPTDYRNRRMAGR